MRIRILLFLLLASIIVTVFSLWATAPGTAPGQLFLRSDNTWATLVGNNFSIVLLNGDKAVGSTTFVVTGTLPAGFDGGGLLLQLDPFTSSCETFAITSLSGQTFTVDRASRRAHSSGAITVIIHNGEIPITTYGVKADSATDNWDKLQRAGIEAQDAGAQLVGALDLGNKALALKQPWFFSELRMKNMRLVAPVDFSTGANMNFGNITNCWAVLKTARNQLPFTVTDHTTNGILFAASSGINGVGSTVAFSNPYGETLPAGIVSGRLYLIKTYDASVGTMTVSEIATPGTTLDITGNGAGWIHPNHESNTRIKWYDVRLSLNATNLNGAYWNLQQQAFTEHFRVDMEYPGSNSIGAQIVGQGSYHSYMEIDPRSQGLDDPGSTNMTALVVGGPGAGVYHYFNFTTINGNGGTGIRVYGSSHRFEETLLESIRHAGFQIMPDASGITIGHVRWASITGTNIPCISDLSLGTSSYDVGSIRIAGTDVMMVRDTTRDYVMHAWDGSATSGNGDTDTGIVFPGYYQAYGLTAPQLKGRRTLINNDDRSMRHIDECYLVDSGGASRIVTLPLLSAGWGGLPVRVVKTDAANLVYVTNRVGDTINGSASVNILSNKNQSFLMIPTRGRDWIPVTP